MEAFGLARVRGYKGVCQLDAHQCVKISSSYVTFIGAVGMFAVGVCMSIKMRTTQFVLKEIGTESVLMRITFAGLLKK